MTISSPLGGVIRDDLGLRLEFDRTFDTTVEDLVRSDRVGPARPVVRLVDG